MSKSSESLHPSTERRPAVWPWLLMPIAALALFLALWSVRHSTAGRAASRPAAQLSDDAAAQ
ncbi:MAG TPA: hypothetical protein VMU67_15470 [Steroidobacteraceae bacterium]|nr:hypothetical protein [Steroidobacteraceae bacterium]